ncbi:hypothetical protein BDY21DRAFT_360770 [Lineolata rhizophorae]|uniref:DNA replication complex GINS protein PSF2 n=1 Tax=Lineolata rhizophorae TaxID=578093 RepID=A0A6A6PCK0_9PEZI|nr:hypothetical protein BDY21DRAFT_360770 [Lineolata rhizophorae]
MALPLPRGLTPAEVAFTCEMELVTIVPRQRLEALELLGGTTPALVPPRRANVALWLALLLKRQRRANIVPPPWLLPASLSAVLEMETNPAVEGFAPTPAAPRSGGAAASPPFLPSCTADAPRNALPYHWLEVGEMLLEAAADDFDDPDAVRMLLKDLHEARGAKVRAGTQLLDAGGVFKLNGVGGMEVAESRGFVVGVIDGLRKIGASREQARREQEEEEGGIGGDEGDDDMDL